MVWRLLQRFKAGRTVLLTTHHMDEADALGDRIAVLSRGRLCVFGTPMQLKAAYGLGYRLRVSCEADSGAAEAAPPGGRSDGASGITAAGGFV